MNCKHPVVQLKIAKEVKEATNMKEVTNYAEFAACISEEALEKMQYLHVALVGKNARDRNTYINNVAPICKYVWSYLKQINKVLIYVIDIVNLSLRDW